MSTRRHIFCTALLFCALTFIGTSGQAQTSSFSYQGRFTDTTVAQPTNGTYQMQFALFDAAASATPIGSTVTNSSVQVTNGVFTVSLDFGANSFDGTARFLEISVFNPTTSAFINLTPRQGITSAPYAIRSQSAASADNATQLNGVAAGQYVQSIDPRLTDARTPTAGSVNYIQNGTAAQGSSNFNISGNGTAGGTLSAAIVSGDTVNAGTQINLNSARFLSGAGNSNIFAGLNAGATNADGAFNSFFGTRAGRFNLTGSGNVFIGNDTGLNNSSGSSNTLLGSGASVASAALNFATALGANAVVSDSNSVVLGRAADTVRIPGNLNVTGTFTGSFTVPAANLTGVVNVANGGTGLAATGAAGNFLRSDGTNWTSAPIQVGDLPNLGNSFIQNGTTQQTGNFNISGNGNLGGDFTAALIRASNISGNNISVQNIDATTSVNAPSYTIGGERILGNAGVSNLFAGIGAGANNAGQLNSFFGAGAGINSTTGSENAFFGSSSGAFNGAGSFNAFFGTNTGESNQGSFNTFIGRQAGFSNTSGAGNVFLGNDTGLTNFTGSSNTLIGSGANVGGNALSFATAIGAGATANASNTITLGRANGADGIRMPGGMGGSLSLNGNTLFLRFNNDNSSSIAFSSIDNGVTFNSPGQFGWNSNGSARMVLLGNGNLNIGGTFGQNSDVRYKTNIQPYAGGLDAVLRLRGVTYNWKPELQKDPRLQIGFIAQEVETVLPELVNTDENGYKSVNYTNAVPVLVEAIKDQQKQIEALHTDRQEQQRQLDELKAQLAALARQLQQSKSADHR